MLAGGVMLAIVSGAMGEFGAFDPHRVTGAVWFAMLYLIFAGSILGFTAYVWLLHHQSPTKVGTYAYVNPVVAVILGYWLGGEPIGARTVVGSLCVLLSVIVITSMRGNQSGRGTHMLATSSRSAVPVPATPSSINDAS